MRTVALGPLVLAMLCTGCAQLGSYLKDRGNDFVDCFSAGVGIGLPGAVEVRATDWLAAGAGYAESYKPLAFRGREAVTPYAVQQGLPLFPLHTWLTRDDKRFERDGGFRFLYTYFCEQEPEGPPILGLSSEGRTTKSILIFDMTSIPRFRYHPTFSLVGRADDPIETEERGPLHAFDVGVDATLGLSAGVSFSPGEFADFVLGFFGLDIGHDDWPKPAAD